MLVILDDLNAFTRALRFLTPSQQSIMIKQKFTSPLSYLLLKPLRYVLRQYSMQMNQLKSGQFYSLIGKLSSISKKRVRKNSINYRN